MPHPSPDPDPPARPPAPLSWEAVVAVMSGRSKAQLCEDFNGPGFAPTQPTPARPGSWEKVLVMAARYARRERLFHPRDAR